jgi:hypothetical protein
MDNKKKIISFLAALLMVVAGPALAADDPLMNLGSNPNGTTACSHVGQHAFVGTSLYICTRAGSIADSVWVPVSGGSQTASTTEEFNELLSGDLTGGISVVIPAGTVLEGAVIAPTITSDSETTVFIRCDSAAFTPETAAAGFGLFDEVTGMELGAGITSADLQDMGIDDATGTFDVDCAGCTFDTLFDVGDKVQMAGFGVAAIDQADYWEISAIPNEQTITLLDPTDLVTADVTPDLSTGEQVYASRPAALKIDAENIGHDAEFQIENCDFTGVANQGSVAILVRKTGPGFRVTLNKVRAQTAWTTGGGTFYQQEATRSNGVVHLKVLDSHIEASASVFNLTHAFFIAGGQQRLDIEGGHVTTASIGGACVDAALEADTVVGNNVNLALRVNGFDVVSGCAGWRVGGGSVVTINSLTYRPSSVLTSVNVPGFIALMGGGAITADVVFLGTGASAAAKPFFYISALATAANSVALAGTIVDRRCGWFNATTGGQLIGGTGGGDATGNVNSVNLDLALGTTCTRHATFIDGANAMSTIARGTVVDAGANREYRIVGTSTITQPLGGIASGASPAATCIAGEMFLDTDETDDTTIATTNDNSLLLCAATNTWDVLENN